MLDLEKMHKSLRAWRQKPSIFQQISWRQCLTAGVLFLALTLILSSNFLFVGVSLRAGEIASRDIAAPKTIEFIDRYKTQQLEEKAIQSVEKVYDFKLQAFNQVKLDIGNIFTTILDYRNNSSLQNEEKIKALRENLQVKLSEKALVISLELPASKLTELETMGTKLVEQMMDTGIKEERIEDAQEKLGEEIDQLALTANEKIFLQEITQKTIAPNLIFNYMRTEKEREKARQSVEPVRQIIPKDLIIVRRGDQVTPEHVALLEALGLQRPRINYQTVGGLAIYSLLVLSLLGIYLWQYRKDILQRESRLYLLGLILLFITFLSKMINTIAISSFPSSIGYLAPVATGAMLITILLDPKLAILVNVVLSAFVGMMNNNDLGIFSGAFFAGMAGIYSVSRVSQRDDLTRAFLIISAVNILTSLTLGLINSTAWQEILVRCIWGIVNAIFSTVLTIGLLPFLEKTFAITTPIKLLELANPNHPLMRKFLLEAPGTYHHSMVVANLAEAAAEKVNGDTLLVRVGSYYHDIGKLNRPYFFIENQLGNDNPHDKISPTLSTLIITSHVKDGVELAREYRLPEDIQDIIRQHHGTSLVSYFYHRATENEKEESLAERDFRYSGPKPQTKEAAIVMLADSVEAAVKSLSKPTPARIEGMVKKIIKDKLNDGQLDECNLTLQDLDIIANAFIHSLGGIYHSRIEYPELLAKEMEGRRVTNGSVNK